MDETALSSKKTYFFVLLIIGIVIIMGIAIYVLVVPPSKASLKAKDISFCENISEPQLDKSLEDKDREICLGIVAMAYQDDAICSRTVDKETGCEKEISDIRKYNCKEGYSWKSGCIPMINYLMFVPMPEGVCKLYENSKIRVKCMAYHQFWLDAQHFTYEIQAPS